MSVKVLGNQRYNRNNVTNKNAVKVNDLVDLYTRASSSMKNAGNSIAETTALFTGGQEIVQDSERTATALRNLSINIQNVSKDRKTGNLFPKMEQDLKRLNIELLNSNGGFKSTYEVLNEVQKAFSNTDDELIKARVSQQLFGKLNSNVGMSIINNWKAVEKSLGDFNNAQGSATQEFTRYQESIEGHSNRLKASTEALKMNLLSSDTVKFFLDMSKGIVDNTTALGGFNKVVIGATIALGSLTLANKSAILASEGFQLTNQIGGVRNFISQVGNSIGMLLGFKTATDGATVSATAFNVATGAMLLGIPLIAQGIGYLANSEKRRNEEIQKSVDNLKVLQSEQNETSNLIRSKEELDKIENKNTQQKKELHDIEVKLAKLIPESTTSYNEQNEALATNLDKIKELNEEKKKQLLVEATTTKGLLDKNIENDNKKLEELIKKRDYLLNELNSGKDKIKIKEEGAIGKEVVISSEKGAEVLKNYSEKITQAQNNVNNYNKAVLSINEILGTNYKTIGNVTKETEKNTQSLKDNAKAKLENAESNPDGLDKELQSSQESFEKITSDLEYYYKLLDEINDKGKLNTSTVKELAKSHQDLLPYVNDQAELIDKVKEKIKEEEFAQKQAYYNMISDSEEYYNEKIKGSVNTTNKLQDMYGIYTKNLGEGYNVDLKNYQTLEQAKGDMTSKLLKGLLTQWGSYWSQYDKFWDENKQDFNDELWYGLRYNPEEAKKFEEIRDKIRSFSKKFNEITIDPIKIDFTPINTSGVTNEKEKKTGEDVKDLDMKIDRYLSYQKAIQSVEDELAKSKALEESLKNDDLIRMREYEIQLMTQKATLLDRLHDKQKEDMNASEQLLNSYGFNAKNGTIDNYRERLEQEIAYSNSISDFKKKKESQDHIKNLEEEIKKYFDLSKAVDDNRVSHKELENQIKKINAEILNIKLDEVEKRYTKAFEQIKEKMSDLDLKDAMTSENNIVEHMDIMLERKKLIQQEID